MLDELLQVESPDSFQWGAYTASDKALRGKKSLATTDYGSAALGMSDFGVVANLRTGLDQWTNTLTHCTQSSPQFIQV